MTLTRHQDKFIISRFGPAHVLQYGFQSLVTDASSDAFDGHKKVLLLVPGNPGVVTFYKYFMKQLYERVKIPIIAVSHVGHVKQGINHLTERVTLKRQVEHKLDFIQSYIPGDVKIIFIGHSIGAYIALEVTRLMTQKERVIRQFLLFPSIERMNETPGCRDLKFIASFKFLFYPIMFILSLLRDEILINIIKTFQGKRPHQPECIIEGMIQMVDWKVIRNVIVMAEDEMVQVQERCDRFIDEIKHKLSLVYCLEDRWAPLKFYRDFKRSHVTDVEILDTAIHAFVMDSLITKDVVHHVADRLQRFQGEDPLALTNL